MDKEEFKKLALEKYNNLIRKEKGTKDGINGIRKERRALENYLKVCHGIGIKEQIKQNSGKFSEENSDDIYKKTSFAEDPTSDLENFLVRTKTSISPAERERLSKIISTTRHSPKRIKGFIKRHLLNLNDALDCLEISSEYNASLKKIEHLLNSGYSTPQIQDLMELRRDILPKHIGFEKVVDFEDYQFFRPDLSEFISYQNLLFLDELAGGTHDVEDIEILIEQIEERTAASWKFGMKYEGIGVTINRMREIYNKESARGYTVSFDILLNTALCYIPEEPYEGRAR